MLYNNKIPLDTIEGSDMVSWWIVAYACGIVAAFIVLFLILKGRFTMMNAKLLEGYWGLPLLVIWGLWIGLSLLWPLLLVVAFWLVYLARKNAA